MDKSLLLQSAALEAAANAIVITDKEGIIKSVNFAFTQLTGYSKEEAVGKHTRLLKSGKQPPEVYKNLWDTILAGKVWQGELINRRKDGSFYTEFETITPVRNEKGEIANFIAIKQNITEKKEAAEKIRVAQDRLRYLIEVGPTIIYVLKIEGEKLSPKWVSENIYRLTGFTVEEALKEGWWDQHVHPEDKDRILEEIKSLPQKEHLSHEYRFRHKDGSVLWLLSEMRLIRDAAGNPGEIVSSWTDIAERKQADEARNRLAAMVENTVDAIIGVTLDGFVFSWNKGAEKIFGFSEQEVIGKMPTDLIVPPDRREEFKTTMEKIKKGEFVPPYETVRASKKGENVEVSLTVSPIWNAVGDIVGASAIARDITERKKLEQKLQQSQKMEVVGRLAGGVAHDFNNILTVILGYCQLVASQLKPQDPLWNQVMEIQKAGEKAATLTRQLLAFSRKQPLQPKVADLNSVIGGMSQMLQRLIGENIELKIKSAGDLGTVKVDSSQIEQVIMNIVVNARDAMPKGGSLTIETSNVELGEKDLLPLSEIKPGPYVRIAITDTGCGMNKETLSHLFEPFFTTKEKGKGTGLGLSMVYGVVRQSGGQILVQSEVGKGSSFEVYFPRVYEKAQQEPRQILKPAAGMQGGETILIVEDEELVRMLLHETLAKSGYNVLDSSSGEEALKIMERHPAPIHLVMTDVAMPGMSGTDLCKKIFSLQKGVKVLLMSGFTEQAVSQQEGVLVPGTPFLQKPFTLDTLNKKVREALDQPQPPVLQKSA